MNFWHHLCHQHKVSIPNIADYYDSRISKKENDKTLVWSTLIYVIYDDEDVEDGHDKNEEDEDSDDDNDDGDGIAGEATLANGNLQSEAFKEDEAWRRWP